MHRHRWPVSALAQTGIRQVLLDVAPVLAPEAELQDLDGKAVARAHDELLGSLFAELDHRGGASDSGAALSPGERWRVIRRTERFIDDCDAQVPRSPGAWCRRSRPQPRNVLRTTPSVTTLEALSADIVSASLHRRSWPS